MWETGIKTIRRHFSPLYKFLRNNIPLPLRRHFVHAAQHGRILHLREPRTFNEKLSWRMVYDRRDILKPTCDKKAMKVYAGQRAGNLVRIPKTIWSGTDVSHLSDMALPDHWVLKPNHRSALVYFGHGRANVDDLKKATLGWLDEVHWKIHGEWAYSHAEQCLILEEFIGSPGQIPVDYKFEVLGGEVCMVEVYHGRFDDMHTNFFDREFTPLNIRYARGPQPLRESIEKPENYENMVEAAERIAAGFDQLRVDLYNIQGQIWFGETTPYAGNGCDVFEPRAFDLELGSRWILPQ